MITGLSHVSIVVPDIEAAARLLDEKYGLRLGPRMLNAEQGVRLAYVELGAAQIELMEPSRPDSPVAKLLERNPKGDLLSQSQPLSQSRYSINLCMDP